MGYWQHIRARLACGAGVLGTWRQRWRSALLPGLVLCCVGVVLWRTVDPLTLRLRYLMSDPDWACNALYEAKIDAVATTVRLAGKAPVGLSPYQGGPLTGYWVCDDMWSLDALMFRPLRSGRFSMELFAQHDRGQHHLSREAQVSGSLVILNRPVIDAPGHLFQEFFLAAEGGRTTLQVMDPSIIRSANPPSARPTLVASPWVIRYGRPDNETEITEYLNRTFPRWRKNSGQERDLRRLLEGLRPPEKK